MWQSNLALLANYLCCLDFLQSPRERHKIKRLGNVLDLSESSDLKRTYNLVLSPQLCAAGKFSAQTKPNIVIDLAT
jgi:hypothetical protein